MKTRPIMGGRRFSKAIEKDLRNISVEGLVCLTPQLRGNSISDGRMCKSGCMWPYLSEFCLWYNPNPLIWALPWTIRMPDTLPTRSFLTSLSSFPHSCPSSHLSFVEGVSLATLLTATSCTLHCLCPLYQRCAADLSDGCSSSKYPRHHLVLHVLMFSSWDTLWLELIVICPDLSVKYSLQSHLFEHWAPNC